ncbi:sugar O-acetyltransferase [Roseisalinus antarcticus]|uniref:Nodulation protein L n=1 Tax=Roseisalinus antarcticus TaxID=254357 RepID=A0A1Y5T738_9RHOB|nr:sugar O-acetyltransferase [Roseisalinus antarcticus]SLN54023.1 Maltose O-acetyltransferase [Roseisalinus antarcticus]
MTEREKMIAGELYRAGDPELVEMRKRAQALTRAYNATTYGEDAVRRPLLEALLGAGGHAAVIRPPFHVDYGSNIHLGRGVFLNFGCVILDVCPVRIGDRSEIGPYVQIIAADHPRDPQIRRSGLELGRPVTLGAHVWVGAGAIVLPGVSIGDDAIIGAGAVVTRDVAAGVTVAGNPARPIGP